MTMPYSLLAAVPSHSGTMIMECTETIVDVQQLVLSQGGSFRFHWEGGSTVSLVRNAIVAEFLASDADLLLMLDSDQAMLPELLERMIELQQPLVGCIYPRRNYDWSSVQLAGAGKLEELLPHAQPYVGAVLTDDEGNFQIIRGFAKAAHVGTGIMLIRRPAFEEMMKHYPELQSRGFSEDAYPQYSRENRWGFFNPMENEEGVPLSEDISFCKRWAQIGGDIWADVISPTVHVGRYGFRGAYAERLRLP
jgi:hypothetical protein